MAGDPKRAGHADHGLMRGNVKVKNIISTIAAVLLIVNSSIAYSDDDISYDDTVTLIKETMANSTSDYRRESYGYIRFDKCSLDYNVLGTYPVGDIYNIRFSNIDFTSLNYQASKAGHDYTAFVILNFDNPFQYNDGFKNLTISTTVVNVSSDEKAQILYKAFLHLRELCGANKGF